METVFMAICTACAISGAAGIYFFFQRLITGGNDWKDKYPMTSDENYVTESYVFSYLYKIDDIVRLADELDYDLTRVEACQVVAAIKRSFHPEVGVNNSVIRDAIKNFVYARTSEDLPKQPPAISGAWINHV